jgi:universal stress protein A
MKVLLAVDNTESSAGAVRAAQQLFPGAELIVFSAAAVSPYLLTEPLGGGIIGMTPSLAQLNVAEETADDAAQDARQKLASDAGIEARTVVDIGDPGRTICDEAELLDVDVIVVGRAHKSWMSRLLDPSVSEYVMKHAMCPVLVVREESE